MATNTDPYYCFKCHAMIPDVCTRCNPIENEKGFYIAPTTSQINDAEILRKVISIIDEKIAEHSQDTTNLYCRAIKLVMENLKSEILEGKNDYGK